MGKTLFISHSTTDDAVVNTIADALEKAGFTVWVDHRHGIEPGNQDWEEAIRVALLNHELTLFILSKASLNSGFCKSEVNRARSLGKPIFVARIEDIDHINDVWLTLENIQHAFLTPYTDEAMQKVIRALNGETGEDLPQAMRATLTGFDTMRLYLPYLNNTLRGRETDLSYIQSNLNGSVLQIVAQGGFGKSRLAAEIAQNYSQGAIWHRCSAVSQDADVLMLLRAHLRLPDNADLPIILAGLADKHPLVVIDNAEDVADDKRSGYISLLSQIVGRGVPVILTSRAVWTELKPRHEYTPKTLPMEVATQLALDFALSEKIVLSTDQAADLADKAQKHPRLIEFAVGQLHERNLERVLRQLSELTHEDIQEALKEMIGKSVMQMSKAKNGEKAETLLRNLTILQGTFALDAVQALAPKSLSNLDDLEDVLILLRRWQFVRRDPTAERYSLAELVRQALGQPDDTVFMDYAAHFTKRADEIFELPQEEWKNHDHDIPNILALGDTLVALYSAEKIDLQTALVFPLVTNNFVVNRMEYGRIAWLDMGLAAARQLKDIKFESVFLNQLGLIWSALGDKRKALGYYEHALLINRTFNDKNLEATILSNIGDIWSSLGNKHKALEYYDHALPLSRKAGNKVGEATILNNIGGIWKSFDKKHKALDYYQQALTLRFKAGDKSGEAATLNNIGRLWHEWGDKLKAMDYYQQSLLIVQSVGDRSLETLACFNIGLTYEELGDLDSAINYIEKTIVLAEQVGNPYLEPFRQTLINLKRKKYNSAMTPKEQHSEITNLLRGMYRKGGADAIRIFLVQNGIPEEKIVRFIAMLGG